MQKASLSSIIPMAILLSGLSTTLSAQVTWEKINGPNESINAMTSSSNNDVFIGTSDYGVFQSADAGTTWDNISADLPDQLIRALGTSSTDQVFAGTGSHGIYKYSSGAWTAINIGLPSGSIIPWSFSKGLNGEMYMVTTSDEVYKWNGTTWVSIKFNLPALARVIAVGSTGTVYVGCFNSGVYRFNGTNSWTSLGAMPNSFVTKMAISTTDTLYVACNSNNVYRIPAAGGAWTTINTGLPALNATALCIDAQSTVFLAFSVNGAGQIYRSVNKGNSWSVVTNSLFTSTFNSMCTTPTDHLFAGASGVYRSLDHGSNWSDMNPGLNARKPIVCFTGAANGKLYTGTQYDGIWRSDDNGTSWQRKNSGLTTLRPLQITTNAAGDILLSAFIPGSNLVGIIFRSTNQGDTWTQAASNGTDLYTKIEQHAADTIWATGRFGGPVLSYSVNNGASWVNRPIAGFSAIWDLEFGPGSTIFLGSESEGVTRSYDGGNTWTWGVGNTTPWYGNLREVEVDNTGYLFAATDWWTNMLWFSVPGSNGDAWTEFLDTDLSGLSDINDLVFDNNNNAYIATNNGQYVDPVYMATNQVWNANTDWVSSSGGLPLLSEAAELKFDASGYLYVVTYFNANGEGGLYRSTSPVNGALPVEFAGSPHVRKIIDGLEVLWSTATEHNCSHFEVERSSDGIDFNKIATVKGNGTTNEPHAYTATDKKPLTGINYYRIKETDRDGKFFLSKIVTAQYDDFEVQVFPNPATDYLHLKSEKTIDHIIIADYSGMEVKTIFQPGIDIDIAELPDGLYLMKVWNAAGQFKNIKISKLKSRI